MTEYLVTTPDGRKFKFKANNQDEFMNFHNNLVNNLHKIPLTQSTETTPKDYALDTIAAPIAGAVKGAASLIDAPQDIGLLAGLGAKALTHLVLNQGNPLRTGADRLAELGNSLPRYGRALGETLAPYTPRTRYGNALETVGEFLPAVAGGVASGGGSVLGKIAQTGLRSIAHAATAYGAQKGSELVGLNEYAPLLQVGTGAATGKLLKHNTAQSADDKYLDRASRVDQPILDDAMKLWDTLKQEGIPVTTAQAIDHAASERGKGINLSKLERNVLQSGSPELDDLRAKTPSSVIKALDRRLEAIMPQQRSTQDIWDDLDRAKHQSTENHRSIINGLTRQLYEETARTSVPQEVLATVPAELNREIESSHYNNPFQATLRKELNLGSTDPIPDNVLAYFVQTYRTNRNKARTAKIAGENTISDQYSNLSDQAKDVIKQIQGDNGAYALATALQREYRERHIEPYEHKLGTLMSNPLRIFFEDGQKTKSYEGFKDLANYLTQSNPTVFGEFLANLARMKINASTFKKNNTIGARVYDAFKFNGNRDNKENFFRGLEEYTGKPEEVGRFKNLIDSLESFKKVQGEGSPTATYQNFRKDLESNGIGAAFGNIALNPLEFLKPVGDYLGKVRGKKRLKRFEELLTTPEGFALLKRPDGPERALQILLNSPVLPATAAVNLSASQDERR